MAIVRGMIPRSPVEPILDDPSGVSGYPALDDLLSDAFDGNRLYDSTILETDWEDATEAIALETDLIAAADTASATADDFDAILEEDLEDWQSLLLDGLDFGVAGTVLALSAAGCATSTSCRGHHTCRPSPYEIPEVVFWADIQRARVVRDAAATTGCGFGVDDEGRASVWAPSVIEMMALARELTARRATFEGLGGAPFARGRE